jgi:hypothetical protein
MDRVGGNGGDEVGAKAPEKAETPQRKLTDEETLAVQLMQARGLLAARGKRIAEQEQRISALTTENMQLSTQVEDGANRDLANKYGLPETFAIERKPDGLYVK